MKYDFDAIVVGSGVTGGWAAKELTARGLRTLVLERGRPLQHGSGYITEHVPPWEVPFGGKPVRDLYEREYPVQSRSYAFDETTRHFWLKDTEQPYVHANDAPFNWFRAGVVGGKSLLWSRQVYRWSDLDFEANARDGHGVDWPIRYRDLAPWYEHVERFIGVSGQALGLAHLPDSVFQPPMEMNVVEKAIRQRIETTFPGRHMTIGRTANLTEHLGDRAACHYCGICRRGCSTGAYFSSLSSTLPAARKTGLLELRANSVVEALDYDPQTKRVTGVKTIDSTTRERQRFTSKLVFVCASTIGSLQILLNSRSDSFPDGIANRSGMLGRYVMDHQDGGIAFGTTSQFNGKYYYGDRPNGIYIPRFRNLDPNQPDRDFLRGYGYQGMAFPLEGRFVASRIPGFGATFKQALRAAPTWGFLIGAFTECLPYPDNQVSLDSDRLDPYGIPQVRFNVRFRDNEAKLSADSVTEARAMLEAAGLQNVLAITQPAVPGNAIHEMGGACMGHDPATSVLNGWNQAHDVPNLYVTDGASMSSCGVVNPSLTFMALTARAVNHAVDGLQRDAGARSET
ncbi:MAG: GMC family oxidoreductase [Pseudomonadales bacterium]|jgi:choline dehydrogenase-like flavoprotein|nr:GMC family oxidoreductase [Pseudomonadales bacterium]MCP5337770.1 GMC family oxidoreductase [Pseudomonadales bacterium]